MSGGSWLQVDRLSLIRFLYGKSNGFISSSFSAATLLIIRVANGCGCHDGLWHSLAEINSLTER